jgi:myo-inositol-1(or 4)-monophosphatase
MSDIAQTVLPIIRKTREMLMPKYGRIEELGRKSTHAASAVTELDHAVEAFLAAELALVDPRSGFVGEETGGDREASRFWLCDPIDGTMYFIRGMPFCTTMLALIEDGKVRFGVIYDFVNDAAYHAELGSGAFMNAERIRVSERDAQSACVMIESDISQKANLARFARVSFDFVTTKTICSGYEHVLVASGKAEARICCQPFGSDYDYAPGALLIQEAGGIVANLGKRTYDFRDYDYIAANPATFKALTEGSDAIFPIKE